MPWIHDGVASFSPFGAIRRCIEADRPTILFLDDFGQADRAVHNAYMQLLLERRLNDYVLSDHVRIIAATNLAEHRAGASRIHTAAASRFLHLRFDIDAEDWQSWAVTAGIDSTIRGYLRFQPTSLNTFDAKSVDLTFACPRTWEFAHKLLGCCPESSLHEVLCGTVGEGPAAQYMAYRELCKSLPDPMSVIANPQAAPIPREPSVLYALGGALSGLAKGLDAKQIKCLATYTARLLPEYACCTFRDSIAAQPKLLLDSVTRDWINKNRDLFSVGVN